MRVIGPSDIESIRKLNNHDSLTVMNEGGSIHVWLDGIYKADFLTHTGRVLGKTLHAESADGIIQLIEARHDQLRKPT